MPRAQPSLAYNNPTHMVADRDHCQYRKRSSTPGGLHSHDWDERRSYQDCFEKADWVGFEFAPAGDADHLFG